MIENKDKKVRQLFIDMDGVLADFESGLSEVLGHKVRLSDVADVYNDRKGKLRLITCLEDSNLYQMLGN